MNKFKILALLRIKKILLHYENVGRMTASHKNIGKVYKNHCYKQFLWQNIEI